MQERRVQELIELGGRVVEAARAQGAEVAEALLRDQLELSAKVRMGQPELIEEAGSHGVGLRVLRGGRAAITHTSDTSARGLELLVQDALELAELSEADPLGAPPEASLLGSAQAELELYDPDLEAMDARTATQRALKAEDAARALDPRITNSEGASFGRTLSAMALVTSGGFSGGLRTSACSIRVAPVCDDQDGKKRNGSHWDARRHLRDLTPAAEVGRRAAEKTLAKLGARKVPTCRVPVVFDPDAGRGLLSLLCSCTFGTAIYQRASYLLERLGQQIASPLLTVVDDPLRPRGLASRLFDGEGLPSRANTVIERGVLSTYLCDTYSARKLGRASTASAARALSARPTVSQTNFILQPGTMAPEEILRGVPRGLYVTSMMGFGFNPVTGDFSRGAEGFWIEDGALTHPVGEVTISLNFNELWRKVDAVGRDLDVRSSLLVPTFRVSEMTVAGS